jgi:serine/threonine-protein kinase
VAPAGSKLPRGAFVGGGAAAILLLGGLTFWLTSGSEKGGTAPTESSSAQVPGVQQPRIVAARDPIRAAHTAINSIIPSVQCSWLNVANVSGDSNQLSVVMGGVAGDPSAAQSQIVSALARAGLPNVDIDTSAIAPIQPGGCTALDAYRQIPRVEPARITTRQLVWHRDSIAKGGDPNWKGQHIAKAIVSFSTGDPHTDLTLVGIEPSGVITPIFPSRAALEKGVTNSLAEFRAGDSEETNPTKTGPDQYQFKVEINHNGWSGLALITGEGPFAVNIISPSLGARGVDWQERFATAAAQHGWKAEMVWFKVEE